MLVSDGYGVADVEGRVLRVIDLINAPQLHEVSGASRAELRRGDQI